MAFPFAISAASATVQAYGPDANITGMVGRIVTTVWILLAGAAVVLFCYAGLTFLLANGDPKKLQQSRAAALWGAAGVIVMILAFSIFEIMGNILGIK